MSDELLGALAPTTEASAAPSGAIAAREVDLALMTRMFNAGYALAHHHTVEGNYTEVHRDDCTTYNRDEVEELLADIRHDEALTQQQGGEQQL